MISDNPVELGAEPWLQKSEVVALFAEVDAILRAAAKRGSGCVSRRHHQSPGATCAAPGWLDGLASDGPRGGADHGTRSALSNAALRPRTDTELT